MKPRKKTINLIMGYVNKTKTDIEIEFWRV